MHLLVAAIGRLKDGADKDLYERYRERLDQAGRSLALGPLRLAEFAESRAETAELRKADEAVRLLKACASADVKIALDPGGKQMTSVNFAKWLAKTRDAQAGTVAFIVGGPDGHGAAVLKSSPLTLSLGSMTLPHGLARIVLAEQLYRAATILSGHPYHRA